LNCDDATASRWPHRDRQAARDCRRVFRFDDHCRVLAVMLIARSKAKPRERRRIKPDPRSRRVSRQRHGLAIHRHCRDLFESSVTTPPRFSAAPVVWMMPLGRDEITGG